MLSRRNLLQALLACGALSYSRTAWADRRRLVVMTSYPQEVISRYVDAFEKADPDLRVDVVWHSGDDARDYLLGEGKGQVDVYWSPSVRTFHDLKNRGAFQKLDIDRAGLPGRIGGQMISDPDGYFEASEIAGYGLVVNPAYLERAGLDEPKDWTDLAKPAYAGHVIFPVPSRIGFAPTITEIILQAHGWTEGWSLLARIAGNATLYAARGDEAMAAVVKGDKGIALSIDFFAAQAIARGAKLRFIYPEANAFEPANIAIPAGAPNQAGALAYLNFVLSEPGQRLLVDPDLRRLAIRPSAYDGAPAGYFNPWTAASAEALHFDDVLFVTRRDIDNALFDRLIFEPRERLAGLWGRIRQANADPAAGGEAKRLLGEAAASLSAVPIDAAEALRLADAFHGRRRDMGEISDAAKAAEAAWARTVDGNLEAGSAALSRAETLLKRG